MKFQFKHQQFQADAASAICDLFEGQPNPSKVFKLSRYDEIVIGANFPLKLSDEKILQNLRGVQDKFSLPISEQLDGRNFSVEMETGVGKTYTYIKTMYELNRRYGWSKFIVVVPSVAIREGVKKTFEVTEEHFNSEYGKKIRHFVYNSGNLDAIRTFVSDAAIWAMIINVQAFNSRSNDARRMLQELDEFQNQIPIEAVAKTNPIIIIDEPQSVEGTVAKEKIKDFKPLMILRYSATHRNIYNLVYRLDALDAYQKRLVKKISVKGIEIRGDKSAGYIFFETVNLSAKDPTATLTFNRRISSGVKKITRKISVGDKLFELSNGLDEYRENFVVTMIDGADNSIEFLNGLKLFAGQVVGDVNEEEFRRIQIRETIQSHLEREAQLFNRGIKVLSLFFIDEVAKYRQYDEQNNPTAGIYAKIFEEEYSAAVQSFNADAAHKNYLESIAARETHEGYFSVDKRNRAANSKDDDVDAYDLIMRDKEKLLDFRTPVRFIFSHSALREGWDNPNVFQICTLKQSSSDIKRRQEVGRGMRLCVNQYGERMDDEKLSGELHKVNILTVIANESYQTFAAGLQKEIVDAINRPTVIDVKIFVGKKLAGKTVDEKLSRKIYNALIRREYLNDDGNLTEKFSADVTGGTVNLGDELQTYCADVVKFLGGGYEISNARADNVEVKLNAEKLDGKNFQELWSRINQKSFYSVNFDSSELIAAAAELLNKNLSVPESFFVVEYGDLEDDGNFNKTHSHTENFHGGKAAVEFDLIGELTKATGLIRQDITAIVKKLDPKIFALLERDAEKFLADVTKIIKDATAAQVIDGISYTSTGEHFSKTIFHATIWSRTSKTTPTTKNIYDHLIFDSTVEKNFATDLDAAAEVSVYAKLPAAFTIPTPLGNYNPDWAIVFDNNIKNIYFVTETKGSTDEQNLRGNELGKISCARKHFDTIGGGKVKYLVVKNFLELLEECKVK